MGVKKYLSIHAHFYQPKRENPWTGVIEENPPNPIYSSYNQMITDQCYGPLSLSTIAYNHDEFINLYSLINFDFGPTLLSWIEKNYPRLYIAIQNADMISQRIYGYGNAIAQIYNHAIMPLLPLREKKLYVRWGIESFKRTFKREPEGMWLAETACDNETLEVLIEAGIKYTILAPHQIKSAKRILDGSEVEIKPGCYLWRSREGKKRYIVIFLYNDTLSQLLFKEISNTEKFALRIKNALSSTRPTIIATDGENYGHHIENGDIYLANLIKKLRHDKIEITNLSFLYHNLKEEFEIEINENTSWSCKHGITRWTDECSCGFNPEYKNKRWKKILKETTDKAINLCYDYYLSSAIRYVDNPKEVLENYITLYEEGSPYNTFSYLQKHLRNSYRGASLSEVLSLVDMMYKVSLSRTSCGFFFDDVSNIETIYNIKNLIFALQFLSKNQLTNDSHKLISEMKKMKSNKRYVDVSRLINEIIWESEEAFNIMLCEFLYLEILNFHILPYKTDWKIRIKQIDDKRFEVQASNIYTFKQRIMEIELIPEKDNLLFKVIDKETAKDSIITLDKFSQRVRRLIELLKSNNPQDSLKKRFLYRFSNSLIPQDIIRVYLELLKTNTAHTLPFAYEFALSVISLAAKTPFIVDIEKEIIKTPLSPLLWKIRLLKEKRV